MLDIRLFLWKSILCRSFLMGFLISLLMPAVALADPPPNPKEQSVPVQLRLIRENLVLMEARLSQQMADIQSSVDVGNGKLNDIYGVVTEVNIELKSTLCFDANGNFEAFVGIHDEVGIGWPNVLSAKATAQGEGAFGVGLAVASQLCVEVPLYSVESYDQLFTNGGEFDDLIAALALPSQSVVPVLAEVYTELMPTPDQAFLAIANVIDASTGYDIFTGSTGTPNHALLLRPDLLLEPVIPHAAVSFIAEVPAALTEALLYPCKTLEAMPIGAALKGREDVKFLCKAHADSLQVVFSVVNKIVGVVDSIWGLVEKIFGKL